MNLQKYGQYKNDIFQKINFPFKKGKKILDVGCGDCTDIEIFKRELKLNTYGIDIYKHDNVRKLRGFKFKVASIKDIPYPDNFFDYVFTHDVLHHIDEKHQRYANHVDALQELRRVCKKGGYIIILEANRYNPLFYPHMVIASGHNHLRQGYFKKIIKDAYHKDGNFNFRFFEAHFYPPKLIGLFKVFEFISEHMTFLEPFRAYNLAEIRKTN